MGSLVSSLVGELDTLDYVIFVLLGIGSLYYYYINYLKKDDSSRSNGLVNFKEISQVGGGSDEGFISKMKSSGRTVAVFYGSQTGTGEELAGRLAKDAKRYGLKAIVLDPEECEMEDLAKLTEIENSLAIFCLATYGEGDPTDNAQQFHEWLQNGSSGDVDGLRFAVFGLGNKTYEHYNEMGILADKRLAEMGGERVYELGLGDDDGNLEEDFMKWREGFWPRVCEVFDVSASGEDVNMRNYRLELVDRDNLTAEQIFTGEMARLGSYRKQRPPFDPKNPFLASIVVNRELHTEKSDRSCKHIDFDISGSRLRYEAGDHAGIFPINDSTLVERFGELLDVDLDTVFKLINLDEDSSKKHPFPCPTTYRTALTHYVDVCTPVKNHVLKEMAGYCTDEADKQKLVALTLSENMNQYHEYIQLGRRSALDILSEFPSCKPPIDLLLEMLPRLQVRYYSISSSPKVSSSIVSITSVVVEYNIDSRQIRGVCTNYLKDKLPVGELKPQVPLFIRKSTLRLPHRAHVPVIMIGPGTGFAPFRGFIQDRDSIREQGTEIGPMILYFGCRRSDQDYIYQDEIEQWHKNGTLTEVHLAFSREQADKVYVQNKLWANRESTWDLIGKQNANVYICGDARNMAIDVLKTFQRICREVGGQSEDDAVAYMKQMEKDRRYQADVWS